MNNDRISCAAIALVIVCAGAFGFLALWAAHS
jgi:hypothetical protein